MGCVPAAATADSTGQFAIALRQPSQLVNKSSPPSSHACADILVLPYFHGWREQRCTNTSILNALSASHKRLHVVLTLKHCISTVVLGIAL